MTGRRRAVLGQAAGAEVQRHGTEIGAVDRGLGMLRLVPVGGELAAAVEGEGLAGILPRPGGSRRWRSGWRSRGSRYRRCRPSRRHSRPWAQRICTLTGVPVPGIGRELAARDAGIDEGGGIGGCDRRGRRGTARQHPGIAARQRAEERRPRRRVVGFARQVRRVGDAGGGFGRQRGVGDLDRPGAGRGALTGRGSDPSGRRRRR